MPRAEFNYKKGRFHPTTISLFSIASLQSCYTATMPQPVEAPRQRWDPSTICETIDPSRHCTCIGVAKNGDACRNKVSKESREMASHRLEILSMCPINESLVSKLQEIAGLLCKRRHQDQATSLSERWCTRLGLSPEQAPIPSPAPSHSSQRRHTRSDRVPTTRAERRVSGSSTSLPTTHQQREEVTVAMVQENQIPFHVSSTRPAVVTVSTASGQTGSVMFRSFRKGRDISDVECGICRERHSEDTVYLNCEECAGEFHWRCMEGWLMHRPPRSNFSCPNCRQDRLFDGFHAARPRSFLDAASEASQSATLPAAPDLPRRDELSEQAPAEPELSSGSYGPSPMEGVRRSMRPTRRPEYFVPS
ncbi:hypothetical protein BDV38DRAFT_275334 [Aspergillus pseudotamarii]|uniref:RING-type domain-containing protein n=1 Tax=Aspergillus pseudotamarii TaxID=132259 RepID=A0A5N6SEK4_ASPPS|nr:uncharacterized protein BDV38DRAFT_275334 [Aspergillus pseudotamarii]KAE8132140.1 hypothetical protein BDV38DRAFT_275334 [Aspergillus pseudotamarii]